MLNFLLSALELLRHSCAILLRVIAEAFCTLDFFLLSHLFKHLCRFLSSVQCSINNCCSCNIFSCQCTLSKCINCSSYIIHASFGALQKLAFKVTVRHVSGALSSKKLTQWNIPKMCFNS